MADSLSDWLNKMGVVDYLQKAGTAFSQDPLVTGGLLPGGTAVAPGSQATKTTINRPTGLTSEQLALQAKANTARAAGGLADIRGGGGEKVSGLTSGQVSALQAEANRRRSAGELSDIRGGGGNIAEPPKTAAPAAGGSQSVTAGPANAYVRTASQAAEDLNIDLVDPFNPASSLLTADGDLNMAKDSPKGDSSYGQEYDQFLNKGGMVEWSTDDDVDSPGKAVTNKTVAGVELGEDGLPKNKPNAFLSYDGPGGSMEALRAKEASMGIVHAAGGDRGGVGGNKWIRKGDKLHAISNEDAMLAMGGGEKAQNFLNSFSANLEGKPVASSGDAEGVKGADTQKSTITAGNSLTGHQQLVDAKVDMINAQTKFAREAGKVAQSDQALQSALKLF